MGRQKFVLSSLGRLALLCTLVSAGCVRSPSGYPPAVEPTPGETRPASTPTSQISPTPSYTASPTLIACPETEGTVLRDSFLSAITGVEFHYRIYLPPCYLRTGRRYPVLYLLHGYIPDSDRMNDDQWDRLGIDETATQQYLAGRLPPMLIVMPNGNDASYADDSGDSPFPRVVMNELIPRIDARYCTWSAASRRAIGGLSRGGYWAYYIAFSRPELFDRVGGHSPFFTQPGSPLEANPENLVDSAEGIEQLAMHIDHGENDYAGVLLRVGLFVGRLEQRGIPVQVVVNEGGDHSEQSWSAQLVDYLDFYAADWPTDLSQAPTCSVPRP